MIKISSLIWVDREGMEPFINIGVEGKTTEKEERILLEKIPELTEWVRKIEASPKEKK